MHSYLRHATEQQEAIVRLIERLVKCESPSDDAVSVDQFADLLAEEARDVATAETFRCEGFGKALRLECKLPGRKGENQLLGLGHSDTVWPKGTLASMPFRESEGRLWGPGVLDMKSGLAFFISAMRLLQQLDIPVTRRLILLVVPDEEVGSNASRALTQGEARRSHAVLVLEPGSGLTGKLKTARKGIGCYTVSVSGRASHAGVDFTEGASAIVELAKQIEHISALTDLSKGTTVNPGVVRGGTRSNVVAAEAAVEVDVRTVKTKDAERIDRKLRALRVHDRRCEIMVTGGVNRPPMERSNSIKKLFGRAKLIGNELGLMIEESSTGGGSDGNFTAALGVPTLDGLGGVGEGAHAINESILTDRIADRVALLAGLLAGL